MTATTGRSVGEVHTCMSGSELTATNGVKVGFIPSCQNTLPALVVQAEGLIVIEECVSCMRVKA